MKGHCEVAGGRRSNPETVVLRPPGLLCSARNDIDFRLPVGDFAGGGGDILDLRHGEMLEVGGVGQRHVLATDPLDWRVEPVEALFHDQRRDFGTDAGKRPALFDGDDAVGFF